MTPIRSTRQGLAMCARIVRALLVGFQARRSLVLARDDRKLPRVEVADAPIDERPAHQ